MSDKKAKQVSQKAIRLDQPIDYNAPPTILSTSLTPELADAALNLTIDFQRQKQSSANSHIILHPYTFLILGVFVGGFGFWKVGWIVRKGGWSLLLANKEELFPVLIFAAMFASTFFTMATRPTDIIKTRADSLVESNASVFGFELKDLTHIQIDSKEAGKKAENDLLKQGENTKIVIYRDTPIAMVSLVPIPELFKGETYVVKITSVGIRKVYLKSGIIDDLFDWVQHRAVQLNGGKFKKLLVLIEIVSTDDVLKPLLKQKDFKFVEPMPLGDSKVLKFYGIQNEIWGLPLNLSKVDRIEEKEGATGSNA